MNTSSWLSNSTLRDSSELSQTNMSSVLDTLSVMASNGSLQNLSYSDCSSAYGGDLQSVYSNVLVVTNDTSENDPIFAYSFTSPLYVSQNSWVCLGTNITNANCTLGDVLRNISHLGGYNNSDIWRYPQSRHVNNVTVSYCLAEKVPSAGCSVRFSFLLMVFIISANVTKLGCMLLLVSKHTTPTLVTVGDAVASFLERKDSNTRNHAMATIDFDDEWHRTRHTRNRLTRKNGPTICHGNAHLETGGKLNGQSLQNQPQTKPRKATRRGKWLKNSEDEMYRPKTCSYRWHSAVTWDQWFLGAL